MTVSDMAEKTRVKYRGPIAAAYEARRSGKTKWHREDAIVREWLGEMPEFTSVIDCPVGTGRFLPFYAEKKFEVRGIDASKDMLALAGTKTTSGLIKLSHGDIFALDAADQSADVAVAIRIMNLISAEDMVLALAELQRVARKHVIFNVRTWRAGTLYRRAQQIETVINAVRPGWRIKQDWEIHEPDFRMIMLTREGA